MKIDGACHCGAVHYQAEVDPRLTIICHCTDCQTMSGAPYRVNVRAQASSLRVTGEPTTYVKIGDSGDAVTTTFCGACGAGLYSCKGEAPEFVNLRLGAIRQRSEFTPTIQGFCESALPWAMDITGVRIIPTAR